MAEGKACLFCGAPDNAHHRGGCAIARMSRIESKIDFILRSSSRKESVALTPAAISALAVAGMNPNDLSTHRIVTLLDDWNEEDQKRQEELARGLTHNEKEDGNDRN